MSNEEMIKEELENLDCKALDEKITGNTYNSIKI